MKLFLYLFVVFVPFTCIAQTMCVRDYTLVISLDKTKPMQNYKINSEENIWWIDTEYGRLYGEGTCLSLDEGLGRTSSMGAYHGVEDYENTLITAEPGLSGVDANGNERLYCWCRLTHPAQSAWTFATTYTVDKCFSQCAHYCGHFTFHHQEMRSGIFGAVGL